MSALMPTIIKIISRQFSYLIVKNKVKVEKEHIQCVPSGFGSVRSSSYLTKISS